MRAMLSEYSINGVSYFFSSRSQYGITWIMNFFFLFASFNSYEKRVPKQTNCYFWFKFRKKKKIGLNWGTQMDGKSKHQMVAWKRKNNITQTWNNELQFHYIFYSEGIHRATEHAYEKIPYWWRYLSNPTLNSHSIQ